MTDKILFKSPAHPYDPEEAEISLRKDAEELPIVLKSLEGSAATQEDLHLMFDAPGQCGVERH